MRIVYLNPCGQLGGAETSLLAILASLRSAVPDWELYLVVAEDGPLVEEARSRGVHVIVEPFPRVLARLGDSKKHPLLAAASLLRAAGAGLQYRRRLRRILDGLRPDVIHTNGFKMHVLGASARRRETPVVWHIHDYVSARRVMSRLLGLFQRNCSAAIANSQSVAIDLKAAFPALRVVPIYNAIDTDRFSPEGGRLDLDALAQLSPGSEGVVRVGLIGTFARWKGHPVFLRALAQLPDSLNVRGYIVGGPIYQTNDSQWSREELEQEAARLGLGGRIGFTGFVRDVPPAMRALDIIVHASTQPEPFGMVIIEAMACGRALVASQAGGAQELFADGENALGHPVGDATALAACIRRLAGDEALRRRLGAAGRAHAEKSFEGRRLAGELVAVYGGVAGTGTRTMGKVEMASCMVKE